MWDASGTKVQKMPAHLVRLCLGFFRSELFAMPSVAQLAFAVCGSEIDQCELGCLLRRLYTSFSVVIGLQKISY